jgi:hypothetical protein
MGRPVLRMALAICTISVAVVAFVPRAGVGGVGRIGGVEGGPGDGQVVFDDLAGNAADDMNAELEALGVHPVGERLEARAVGRRRETVHGGNEDAVGVPDVLLSGHVFAERIIHVPAFVDDGILPAELAQAGEDGGVGAVVGFIDGEAVGVPAVPAQRRRWGRGLRWQLRSKAKSENQ